MDLTLRPSENDGLLSPSPSSRLERGNRKRLDQRLARYPEVPKGPAFSRRVEVLEERQIAGGVVGEPLVEARYARFVKSLLAVPARFPLVRLQCVCPAPVESGISVARG